MLVKKVTGNLGGDKSLFISVHQGARTARRCSLDSPPPHRLAASRNHHCHLPTHTFYKHTRTHVQHTCTLGPCDYSVLLVNLHRPNQQSARASQPADQCVAASHQGPDVGAGHYRVSATLSARAASKSKGSAAREKGANISSITPERHRGGMQIASQETPGGVKEELAGRRREANECSGKCIQGGGGWGRGAVVASYSLIHTN